MPNSTITLEELVDDASTLGDVSPALSTGGHAFGPALSIANDVMQALINGGPAGQPYNWKWNRVNLPAFTTISYQQDYFIPGLVNLGWIESAWASFLNQTSIPKSKQQIEVRKDLQVTSDQTGSPGKLCWLPNTMLQTGVWGQVPLGPTPGNPSGDSTSLSLGAGGQQNPGPNVIYTDPKQQLQTPTNATTAIKDPNGNLWALTTFGQCGSTAPAWPDTASITYPTPKTPTTVATTVQDGSCVWTAINPSGQGIRLNPIPPQNGVVWLIQAVGQNKAPRFYNLGQTLEPVPDDYEWAFKNGFFAECYRRNPDPRVRSKYAAERQLWLESLDKAVRQADREEDDYGFYPGSSIMQSDYCIGYGPSPANPYGR